MPSSPSPGIPTQSAYFTSYPSKNCFSFTLLPSPWEGSVCTLSLWICLSWIIHINGLIWYVTFSFSIMFPRLIHGLLVISTSFLFMTESYSILRIYNILLLIEILDCLQFRAFMNNASLNICVQIFVWLQILNCVNYIPRNRTAGSYGNFFL